MYSTHYCGSVAAVVYKVARVSEHIDHGQDGGSLLDPQVTLRYTPLTSKLAVIQTVFPESIG